MVLGIEPAHASVEGLHAVALAAHRLLARLLRELGGCKLPVPRATGQQRWFPCDVRIVIVATLVMGCTTYERHVVVNDGGGACLYESAVAADQSYPATLQTFTSRSSVVVAVGVAISTCDRDAQAWCGVERDGTTLRIDSLASWIPWEGPCSREAAGVGATCETEELDAGTYAVVYGSATTSLTVPSTALSPCLRPGSD